MRRFPEADGQLTAFLTSLFTAVESAPAAALVYTLAIGKDGTAVDAYNEENQFIADRMAEAESVSARKATLLNPTGEDETVKVLRRRLFERIDEARIPSIVDAYRQQWTAHREALPTVALRPETAQAFAAGYPLHLTCWRPSPARPRRSPTSSVYAACCGCWRVRSRSSGSSGPPTRPQQAALGRG